jgi:hypothetical protein
MGPGTKWLLFVAVSFSAFFLVAVQWTSGPTQELARRALLQMVVTEEEQASLRPQQNASGADPAADALQRKQGLQPQQGDAWVGVNESAFYPNLAAPRIVPSVPLAYVASPRLPGLRGTHGLSDPSVVFFKGHYIAAFTKADAPRVHFAVSEKGHQWKLCDAMVKGMSWPSLFVHRGQLYLLGPEGVLWFRRTKTNDLVIARLEFDPASKMVKEVDRARLTRGYGVHILNNVPLVMNDTVFFPFNVAAASTRWRRIRIEHFVAANASVLDQGKHAARATDGEVLLEPLDWDASVFGVAVAGPQRLGRNAFLRFEERNVTMFARVAAVEGSVLWVVPERWHADCTHEEKGWACKDSITRAAGAVRLTTRAALLPDSPLYQEFLLSVLQSAPGADLLDPSAWRMAPMVGNPVARYPQAHRLWAGPAVQERSVHGTIKRCTGTGFWECSYWQEPVAFAARDGRSVHVAVRFTADQNCNSALLCTLGAGGDFDCEDFAPVPGFGNVRGYVFYDNATRLYWALNNFNLDTTLIESGKGFRRAGQRCFDQRGNVGLFYSGDMHNWVLAKVVTKANSNKASLSYVSCTVNGADLMCVGKTNGRLNFKSGCLDHPSGNHHSSQLIVAFRIPNFRALVH